MEGRVKGTERGAQQSTILQNKILCKIRNQDHTCCAGARVGGGSEGCGVGRVSAHGSLRNVKGATNMHRANDYFTAKYFNTSGKGECAWERGASRRTSEAGWQAVRQMREGALSRAGDVNLEAKAQAD